MVFIGLAVSLYLVAMLRPLGPVFNYVLNFDYISTVLCINQDKPEMACHGTCQLSKQIQDQENQDEGEALALEDFPWTLGLELIPVNLPQLDWITHHFNNPSGPVSQWASLLFQPPEFPR